MRIGSGKKVPEFQVMRFQVLFAAVLQNLRFKRRPARSFPIPGAIYYE